MKKYYSDSEFTEKGLPHNRKQMFFDCTSLRYPLVLALGAIMLGFAAPLLVLSFTRDVYASYYINGGQTELYNATVLLYGGINVVCYAFLGLGLGGVMRVTLRLTFGESVFFREDFTLGIKQNGRRYAGVFFVLGLVMYGNDIIALSDLKITGYIYFGVTVMLIVPIAAWILLQTAVYDMTLRECLSNSVKFLRAAYLPALVPLLLTVLPFAAELLPFVFIKYAVYIIALVFYLPPLAIGWQLFANRYFDKFINEKSYPELVNKGIAAEDD